MPGVGVDQRENFLEQLGIGDDRTAAEIDEAPVGAITLRPPAVLVDQHASVKTPALVVAFQAPQHAQQTAEQGCDRQ